MKFTVIGCGDAFGTGGRLQTAFHVDVGDDALLIDCGATTIHGCRLLRIDVNRVSTILVSHLHGDHFGGLVWWLLFAIYGSKREAPLTIAGPAGIEERFNAAAEALYPGSLTTPRKFDMRFLELRNGEPLVAGPVTATPFEVSHPSGAPSYALRIAADGKVIGFSGDTEWVEALVPVAMEADLFVSECQSFETPVRFHMTWRAIERNLDRLTARRILLTHMGPEMLERRHEVTDPRVVCAEDGMSLDI